MVAPATESGEENRLERALMQLQAGNPDSGPTPQILDDTCEALLKDYSFLIEAKNIRDKCGIPKDLTAKKDLSALAILHEEKSERLANFIDDSVYFIKEQEPNSKGVYAVYKNFLDYLHKYVEDERNLQPHGFDLVQMEKKERAEFYAAIKRLLRKRGLSPLLFEWTKWFVLYRDDNKSLRQYYPHMLAYEVMQHMDAIADFRLTAADKKAIKETLGYNLERFGSDFTPAQRKQARKELKEVLSKSAKNTFRRTRIELYNPDDDAPYWIEAQNRLRQRRFYSEKRSAKLISKKLKK